MLSSFSMTRSVLLGESISSWRRSSSSDNYLSRGSSEASLGLAYQLEKRCCEALMLGRVTPGFLFSFSIFVNI